MNGPSSSSSPAPLSREKEAKSNLLKTLSRTRAVVQDGLHRLEMAQSDARGENDSLDAIDASLQEPPVDPEGAGRTRARKIAASVAEDLEAAAARLRQAAQS
jgi:hypothetical protein